MKQIPLTLGKVALVDDTDYDYLMQWNWRAHPDTRFDKCYVDRKEKGRTISMHRVIMDAPAELYVDHINGNGLDNRRENLRLCSNSENQRNSARQRNNTSGYKGVSWKRDSSKYRAQIMFENKNMHLGNFPTAEEAARAYDAAAKRLFGPFAKLNF